MKNMLVVVLVLICCLFFSGLAGAQDSLPSSENSNEDWEIISFPFLPGNPPSFKDSNTYGIRIGLPISFGGGKVCGIETGAMAATTDNVYGIQTCPVVCISKYVEGLQTTIVNVAETVKGLQLGVFNYAEKESIQLGVINVIEDGWIPFTIIFNMNLGD